MGTKNNSAADNNVLTKSDSESNFPINFQPMPKRFMIWDSEENKFLSGQTWAIIPTLPTCGATRLYKNIHNTDKHSDEDCVDWGDADLILGRYLILQFTGIYNNENKEILEGDIVRVGGETGVVQMVHGEWHAVGDDDIPLSAFKSNGITKVGHIYQNPELLEEK